MELINEALKPLRRILMPEMRERLGRVSRHTVLRREHRGLIPKRRLFPDGQMGWLESDIDAWFQQATAPIDNSWKLERARRLGR